MKKDIKKYKMLMVVPDIVVRDRKSSLLKESDLVEFDLIEKEIAKLCFEYSSKSYLENQKTYKESLILSPDVIISTEKLLEDYGSKRGVYVYYKRKGTRGITLEDYDEIYYATPSDVEVALKDFSKKKINGFIESSRLKEFKEFPCDIYIRVGAKQIKLFNEADPIDEINLARIKEYEKRGVLKFIADDMDLIETIEIHNQDTSDEENSELEVKRNLTQVAKSLEFVSEHFLEKESEQEKIIQSVRGIVNALCSDQNFNKIMAKMARSKNKGNLNQPLLTLSVGAWILMKFEYKKDFEDRVLKSLGVAALTKDISFSVMQRNDLLDINLKSVQINPMLRNTLSEKEYEINRMHPHYSAKVAETLDPALFNEQVLEMIRNHHEQPNGRGYPSGVNATRINFTSALMIVSNAIATEICNGKGLVETLDIMLADKQWKRGNFKKIYEYLHRYFEKATKRRHDWLAS